MFRGVKNNWRKAEAAAAIQSILEIAAKHRRFGGDAAKLAFQLVDGCWDRSSKLLDGSQGPRPHRLAFASVALSDGIQRSRELGLSLELLAYCQRLLLHNLGKFGKPEEYTDFDGVLIEKSDQILELADGVLGEAVVNDQFGEILMMEIR